MTHLNRITKIHTLDSKSNYRNYLITDWIKKAISQAALIMVWRRFHGGLLKWCEVGKDKMILVSWKMGAVKKMIIYFSHCPMVGLASYCCLQTFFSTLAWRMRETNWILCADTWFGRQKDSVPASNVQPTEIAFLRQRCYQCMLLFSKIKQ